ncbi:glycosyltransferase family 17 protein [Cystobasidium minutum MCA 4210]|uniref:glycosyltransferase family 17 protein n=1 Tax=Cystobasidium minutum MCA 4210 TaxID=1397322 RepID=UPI0034CE346D|eukprot:jgi/Rhomi1/145346/e_gw1.5.324.1
MAAGYSRVCKAHSLQALPENQAPPKVYDVVIFSVELDLLEIRMRELYSVVDYFVVLESNVTFSGEIKPLTFQDNQGQFAFARDKIVHGIIGDLKLSTSTSDRKAGEEAKKEDPFKNEIKMRNGVSRFIDSLKPAKGDIIIQSDVDEITSSRAVLLLKHCTGYPDIVHLGMPSYLYSFEFPMERKNANSLSVNNGEGAGPRQWRASAKKYGTKAYNGYTHSRQSDTILEKAGWHLTFAFKYIEDFIFKMKSYSHNDRVTSPDMLSPAVIQEKICTGADIYNMLPEAYDFRSLLDQWGRIPSSRDVRNIPKSVLEHEDKFGYLLPGGCKREHKKPS